MSHYAITPNGIFWSIQGEGHLQGFQMAFLRLAGCSVNCPGCDTNYTVAEKLSLEEIVDRLKAVMVDTRDQWIWVTGGEPADLPQQRQVALIGALKAQGWSVAVATSGNKRFIPPVDWLSVSPHTLQPEGFQQRYGNEVKLVDRLKNLDMEAWAQVWDRETDFLYRYVQPLSRRGSEGWRSDPESVQRCMDFLKKRPRWAFSEQRHHQWGVA